MTRYSVEPRIRKYIKPYGFLSTARNPSNKYVKRLLDVATKSERDALKTATKKVAQKVAEARVEFIGNKITDKVLKQKPVLDENSINIEEIIFPPEK